MSSAWIRTRDVTTSTKNPTTLYVLDADHGTKVGITAQTIEARVSDLERGSGFRPEIVATWPIADPSQARHVEQVVHWLLRDTRTVGEWFHCHPLEAKAAVDRVLRSGVPLSFYHREEAA